jgi:hypothetical protein
VHLVGFTIEKVQVLLYRHETDAPKVRINWVEPFCCTASETNWGCCDDGDLNFNVQLMEWNFFWRPWLSLSWSLHFPHFVEPEGLKSFSQERQTDPYPPPDEFNQLLIRYKTLMSHSTPSCFKWPLTTQAFLLTLYASLILTTFTCTSRALF